MKLETPHSGSHWDGDRHPFFEGWYYRLTLPADREEAGHSFAFMYSLQDIGKPDRNTAGESSGIGVQILGPDERYFSRYVADLSTFWCWKDRLGHGYRKISVDLVAGSYVESYRATADRHAGQFFDPSNGLIIRWDYRIKPMYGWGNPFSWQKSTAGWLSKLQFFEPGWQILMAHGKATGWFEWNDPSRDPTHPERFEFSSAPAYAEKNWGGAFPQKWFWLQCNAFEHDHDLSVTSGGGIRKVLGWEESVAMVGIHSQGRFYEFVPWNGRLSWEIHPWGYWRVIAEQGAHVAELVGWTDQPGFYVQVPTAKGLEFRSRDTMSGTLSLQLWERQGSRLKRLIHACSHQAGLEVGGADWETPWLRQGFTTLESVPPLSGNNGPG